MNISVLAELKGVRSVQGEFWQRRNAQAQQRARLVVVTSLPPPLLCLLPALPLCAHTHWHQLQSQWDALHSWQRKNTAAGERKQIQSWQRPLPSCSVRAPVKTELLV